ncbi:ABC transporter substrate-binding protein [Rhodoferax sp. BLA1]|uniref:ABC transporter substrate-binding protein n=1 Tax=Rhodoferax sp. BLA1 TaxID=2576062 RepID=UPI0015D17C8C|nr:ABC transporter substrate-binding protein [Rhodoferax sp. BLA1]
MRFFVTKSVLRRLFGLWLAVFALCAWSATVEVTDALGRKVKVNSPVQRIALNFNFEEFTAVAGKDNWAKVVGISRAPFEGWRPVIFSRYAAVIPNLQAMPDIGHSDDGTFSAEKVIALKPDVLFIAEWTYKSLQTAREQIESAGIPIVVIDYNAQLLERHLSSTRAIGKVMGTEARAEELTKLYEREFNGVLSRIAKAGGPSHKKVYVELGQAGTDTVGNSYSGTMWGKMLTTLGAVNVADGKLPGPWGPVNPEAVIADNPDLIFIAGSSWVNKPKAVKTGYEATPEMTRQTLLPYAQRPAWANIKAVKNGEVHAIEHGLCRTLFDFVAMQYIAKRLYPDAFKDVDPEASFKAYHAKYLPVAYAGTWMLPLKP